MSILEMARNAAQSMYNHAHDATHSGAYAVGQVEGNSDTQAGLRDVMAAYRDGDVVCTPRQPFASFQDIIKDMDTEMRHRNFQVQLPDLSQIESMRNTTQKKVHEVMDRVISRI